jgi:hypothetical protein
MAADTRHATRSRSAASTATMQAAPLFALGVLGTIAAAWVALAHW